MTTLHLIGIIGKAGAGKDTIGDHITKNYNGVRYAFADPIKDITRRMFLFDEEQLYGSKKEIVDERWGVTPRQTFQVIGTNLMQLGIYGFLPNMLEKVPVHGFWVYHFKLWYNDFISKPENKDKIIVVTDVRFPHEAEVLRELNGLLIKVERPDLNTNSDVYEHTSETSVDTMTPDVTLINDTTIDELYEKLDTVMTNF